MYSVRCQRPNDLETLVADDTVLPTPIMQPPPSPTILKIDLDFWHPERPLSDRRQNIPWSTGIMPPLPKSRIKPIQKSLALFPRFVHLSRIPRVRRQDSKANRMERLHHNGARLRQMGAFIIKQVSRTATAECNSDPFYASFVRSSWIGDDIEGK